MKIKRLLNLLVTTTLLFVISGFNQPATAQCSHCDHGYIRISENSGTYGVSRAKKQCPMCGDYYPVGSSHVHRCPYCSENKSSSSSSSSYDDDEDYSSSDVDPTFDASVRVRGEFADDPTMAIHNTGYVPQNQRSQSDEEKKAALLDSVTKKKKSGGNGWIWGLAIAAGVGFFMLKKK